ncbi:hypothetical protein GGR92_003130 [Spirosoma lacussanchae]|uniref:hypothetical protein n=1 Tax=Spirosoma lacussanchae TaxID=1884249 RepID=UPI001108D237|nr:hypothetical protein [Spirosoma lacussanchae]
MILKFTIAIFFLANLALKAQNEEKKYEFERLTRKKNRIQQILTYRIDLATNDSSLTEHKFYDNLGNLIERRQYDSMGKLRYKGIFDYNDKGLCTQETGYDGNSNLLQLFIYTYDKNGNQTDYQQLSPDKKIWVHQKSVFNSQGQRIKLYNHSEERGGFYLSATFAYDSAGRAVSSTTYSIDGDTGSSDEYRYDDSGNLIETYQVMGDQKTLVYKNRYNEKNQLTEKQYYQRNQHITNGRPQAVPSDRRMLFTYDTEGNVIDESTWNKTTLVKRTRYYFVKKIP